MRHGERVRGIAACAMLALVLLSSSPLSSGADDQRPEALSRRSDYLRIAFQDDIKGLNPFVARDEWSSRVLAEIYDRTVNVDWSTNSTQPWIAVEWCHESRADPAPGACSSGAGDDDPLNVSVRYRVGAWADKWGTPPGFHDGEPVSVDDIVFSYSAMVYDNRSAQGLRALLWTASQGFDWASPPYGDSSLQRVTVGADGSAGGEEGWLGVQKIDDHSLRFSLQRPFPDFFLETLDARILPRHVWEKHIDVQNGTGDYLTWDMDHDSATGTAPGAVGSGPYRLTSWARGQSTRLERFGGFHDWTSLPRVDDRGRVAEPEAPAYDPAWSTHRPAPRVAGIEYSIYLTTEAAALALQQGKVDAMAWPVPPSMVNDMKSGDKCTDLKGQKTNCGSVVGSQVTRQQGFTFLGFNMRRLPIGYDRWDPKNASSMVDVGEPFRKAIAFSTDKKTIVSQVLQDHGIVAHGPITPDLAVWYNTTLPEYRYDEAEANRRLNAAGWPRDPSCPKIGNPAEHARKLPGVGCAQVEILSPEAAYEPVCAVWGQMVEAAAQKVGLNVKSVPTAHWKIDEAVEKGQFQMYGKPCRTFPGDVGRRPGAFLRSFYYCGGQNEGNIVGYCDPAVDALLDEYDLTMDIQRRVQIVKDVQGIVTEDIPLNPLFFRSAVEVYRKDRFVVPMLSPPRWIQTHEGIINRWSMLLVEHPGKPTELQVEGPARVVCGQFFAYDFTFTASGVPVESAFVSATATHPVTLASNSPTLTDVAGRARLLFRADPLAANSQSTLAFVASKVGHIPQKWSATVSIECERPEGIRISAFVAEPACVAPGESATVSASVAQVGGSALPVGGAVVRMITISGGEISPREVATDAAGKAEFRFSHPSTSAPPATLNVSLRARAAATINATEYESPDAWLTISVDPGGCGRPVRGASLVSSVGLIIAIAGAAGPAAALALVRRKSARRAERSDGGDGTSQAGRVR
jgi:ABC-type transport system substrate-binding protein